MSFRDGYIVWAPGQQEALQDGDVVGAKSKVMQYAATVRGRILSHTYDLEMTLDRVILLHLFRARQDGMAAFFEDNILRENAFGLDRKVKLVAKASRDWFDPEDAQEFARLLADAKAYRNRIAHWPMRLYPCLSEDGSKFQGFDVKVEKGDEQHMLNPDDANAWISVIVDAANHAFALANQIERSAREE